MPEVATSNSVQYSMNEGVRQGWREGAGVGRLDRYVTSKTDDQKRLMVPLANPRQVYDVQGNADGTITLSPIKVEQPVSRFVRFEKEGRYTAGVVDAPIDPVALKEALADFP